MNPQEVFDTWKAQRSQDDVSPGFADRVITAIRRREATRAMEGLASLRALAAQPWAKAAALILGSLLGLARIFVTLHLILFA